MSLLMQYFVCEEKQIHEWVQARSGSSHEAEKYIEKQMACATTLKNVSGTDVRLLATCAHDLKDDDSLYIERVEVIADIEALHVLAFNDTIISRIANLCINKDQVEEWAQRAGDLTYDPQHRAKYLTNESANALQQMCRIAQQEGLGFYCCYFG